jgi:8-oxo-dGTP pyrophosphatase MutT (NUDIX family)
LFYNHDANVGNMTRYYRGLNKQLVANLIRRVPWVGHIVQTAYRVLQPHVTVGAVGAVFDAQGQLLLVEHVFHPRFPWGLPGGWMARREAPADTVRREVFEETGLRVDIIRPLAIVPTLMLRDHLDVAFLCELAPESESSQVKLSGELLDFRWADPLDLPKLGEFHTRVVAAALAERSLLSAATPQKILM